MMGVQLQLERVQIQMHSYMGMYLLWLLPCQTDCDLARATKAIAAADNDMPAVTRACLTVTYITLHFPKPLNPKHI